jgi:hypothetical protein
MPPVNCCHVLLTPLIIRARADAAGSVWAIDVPTWITAVGTAILAVFAIVTAIYAVRAFRKQSKEVSDQAEMLRVQSDQLGEQRKINAEQTEVLSLQASELRESLDERKREAVERRQAQASRVFIWEERGMSMPVNVPHFPVVTVHVVNSSDQPVYDAELVWRCGSDLYGSPNPQPLPTIMPGGPFVSTGRDFPPDTSPDACGAVLRFRDASGVKWMRRPDGGLTEQQ